MKRVAVTGLGVVTPLGLTVADFAAALCAGRSGIGPITILPAEEVAQLQTQIAAELGAGYEARQHFDPPQLALLDRTSQFAVLAARQAVAASGLDFRGALGARTAAIIGSGVGGQNTQEENYRRLYIQGQKRLHPLTIPRLMVNAPASHVSMAHGITGPSFAVASACSSSNHAIGLAFQMVRSGTVAAAVTGGTDACITFGTIRGWEALRVMAPDTCRPFSRDRKGMVLGEGAAALVLEDLERAVARGAPIHAELIGFGMTSDAGNIVTPDPAGAAAAIRACLADARLDPAQVDYVNAHGTATGANDATETQALHRAFGDHARKLMISSTKSMHGHALGGAGAIELAAAILALERGFVPPTANFTEPDPECDLDYVPNEARQMPIKVALSSSFAFGGHNAVLAIQKYPN
jgi:nodulation protein E